VVVVAVAEGAVEEIMHLAQLHDRAVEEVVVVP
jgi:hypothetical protein